MSESAAPAAEADERGGIRRWLGPAFLPQSRGRLPAALPDVIAALALAIIARRWLTRLTSFLVNDDEGSYLYAAWRVSLGERPYCDFLTPQLPGFLIPGGALMRVTGPEVWPARAFAVVVTLLAAVLVWSTARRLFGPWVALVAGAALLLHPDIFESGRTFRSEPFMLFLQAAGVYVFARAALPRPEADEPPNRLGLAFAGAIFGLATLTKLFGPLPLAGLLAWLLFDGRRRGRPLGAMAADAALTISACGAVVAAGLGAFMLGGCDVFTATVAHHGMQNAGAAPLDVLGGGLGMLGVYVRDAGRAVPAAAAIAIAVAAIRAGDRRAALFGWQLPTVIALLVLSRDRFPRHLLYLTPAIVTLFGVAVVRLSRLRVNAQEIGSSDISSSDIGDRGLRRQPRLGRDGAGHEPKDRFALAIAISLAAAVLGAWWLFDRDYLWSRSEDGTQRAADLIALTTAPDEIVLSDYSELNFYARRPTTYSAASLSSGAARSGQISWAGIRSELDTLGREPALIVREIGSPYSHLSQLKPEDRAAFEAWLATNTVVVGTLRRDAQTYEVRALGSGDATTANALPHLAQVGESLRLLAAGPDRSSAGSGDRIDVLSAWAASGTPAETLVATVRLTDGDGRMWAQADDALRASGARTTEQWLPDELTAHRITLDVPLGLPPGGYILSLGVYRRDDLSRLTLTDARNGAERPSIEIGAIEIEPWRPGSARGAASALGLERVSSGGGPEFGFEVIGARLASTARLSDEGWATSGEGQTTVGDSEARATSGDPDTGGSRAVEAGTIIPIEIAWLALRRARDISARITLTDPQNGGLAADHTFVLGSPGAPTSAWPEGTVARHRFGLPVLGNAASGDYVMRVIHFDVDGTPLRHAVEIGRVRVEARDLTDVVFDLDQVDERRLSVRFGDAGALVLAELNGASLQMIAGEAEMADHKQLQGAPTTAAQTDGTESRIFRAGDTLEIDLAWRAIAPSEWPYQVSVQIIGTGGDPIAQSDQPPTAADGTVRPTFGWIPGEIVRDLHAITIPTDAEPGSAEIAVTLYRAETGRRLPARLEGAEDIEELQRAYRPRIVDDLARVGRVMIVH